VPILRLNLPILRLNLPILRLNLLKCVDYALKSAYSRLIRLTLQDQQL